MNLEHTAIASGAAPTRRRSWNALLTGVSGAAAVTLAHEVVRQVVPNAPRMDRLGMVALSRGLKKIGVTPPRGMRLRGYALLGDLASNAVYYAPTAMSGRRPWLRWLVLGIVAGLGAVALAPAVGLPRRHRGLKRRTQGVTVALYAIGGLVAAAVASYLDRGTREASARRASGVVDESSTRRVTQAGDLDVLEGAM